MDTLLITGAQGFLGCRLARYYARTWKVVALGHKEMDITSKTSVSQVFETYQPKVVVHCAAISNTGYSQEHPDESWQVNVMGTVHVALACKEIGCKLVYMSSDQVYNGNLEDFLLPESILAQPVSVYGKHKLEAERRVAEILPDAVGLRLTWMYDFPDSPLKNTGILLNLKNTYEQGRTLKASLKEHRAVTYVWEVVKNMEKTFTLSGGVYNYGSENTLTSYETYLQLARHINLPEPEQWILADKEFRRNLSMDISKIREDGISFPDSTEPVQPFSL